MWGWYGVGMAWRRGWHGVGRVWRGDGTAWGGRGVGMAWRRDGLISQPHALRRCTPGYEPCRQRLRRCLHPGCGRFIGSDALQRRNLVGASVTQYD